SAADGPAQVVAADPHLAPAAVLVAEPAAAQRTGPARGLSAERARARRLPGLLRRAAAGLRGRGRGRRARSGQVLLLAAEHTELRAVSAAVELVTAPALADRRFATHVAQHEQILLRGSQLVERRRPVPPAASRASVIIGLPGGAGKPQNRAPCAGGACA